MVPTLDSNPLNRSRGKATALSKRGMVCRLIDIEALNPVY